MTESSSGPANLDPYKTYRFRLKWDGRYVAGISRVGALRRSTEVVGNPNRRSADLYATSSRPDSAPRPARTPLRRTSLQPPSRSRSPGRPPLPLEPATYLLSAHGRDDDDPEPFSHRLLGEAMRVLHEQPVLDLAEPGVRRAGEGCGTGPESPSSRSRWRR